MRVLHTPVAPAPARNALRSRPSRRALPHLTLLWPRSGPSTSSPRTHGRGRCGLLCSLLPPACPGMCTGHVAWMAKFGDVFVVQQAQECDDPERRRRRPSASQRKTAKVPSVPSLHPAKLTLCTCLQRRPRRHRRERARAVQRSRLHPPSARRMPCGVFSRAARGASGSGLGRFQPPSALQGRQADPRIRHILRAGNASCRCRCKSFKIPRHV